MNSLLNRTTSFALLAAVLASCAPLQTRSAADAASRYIKPGQHWTVEAVTSGGQKENFGGQVGDVYRGSDREMALYMNRGDNHTLGGVSGITALAFMTDQKLNYEALGAVFRANQGEVGRICMIFDPAEFGSSGIYSGKYGVMNGDLSLLSDRKDLGTCTLRIGTTVRAPAPTAPVWTTAP